MPSLPEQGHDHGPTASNDDMISTYCELDHVDPDQEAAYCEAFSRKSAHLAWIRNTISPYALSNEMLTPDRIHALGQLELTDLLDMDAHDILHYGEEESTEASAA